MTFPLINLLIEFNQNHCFGLIKNIVALNVKLLWDLDTREMMGK